VWDSLQRDYRYRSLLRQNSHFRRQGVAEAGCIMRNYRAIQLGRRRVMFKRYFALVSDPNGVSYRTQYSDETAAQYLLDSPLRRNRCTRVTFLLFSFMILGGGGSSLFNIKARFDMCMVSWLRFYIVARLFVTPNEQNEWLHYFLFFLRKGTKAQISMAKITI